MDSRLRQLVETVVRIVPTAIVQTAAGIAAVVAVRAEAAEEAVVAGQAAAVAAGVADRGTERAGHGFARMTTDSGYRADVSPKLPSLLAALLQPPVPPPGSIRAQR